MYSTIAIAAWTQTLLVFTSTACNRCGVNDASSTAGLQSSVRFVAEVEFCNKRLVATGSNSCTYMRMGLTNVMSYGHNGQQIRCTLMVRHNHSQI